MRRCIGNHCCRTIIAVPECIEKQSVIDFDNTSAVKVMHRRGIAAIIQS